jgi:hypothetical protein
LFWRLAVQVYLKQPKASHTAQVKKSTPTQLDKIYQDQIKTKGECGQDTFYPSLNRNKRQAQAESHEALGG